MTEGVCIMASMKEDRTPSDKNKYYWMWREEKKKRQEVEGETSILKGIGNTSPEMKEKDKLIQELRMRIRDMLLISEQHRSILGAEITNRKRLEKEVKDLKVQMSEYLSVRTRGAGSVS